MKKLRLRYLLLFYRVMAIVLSFVIIESCAKSSPGLTPPANEVYISSSSFNPSTISIIANTTIKWTNKDGISHTVTSDALLFDSGSIHAGASFSQQFTIPGTYTYHCSIHSNMRGTVIVH